MKRLRALAILIAVSAACVSEKDWVVGGLYSISNGDGTFGVVKVLAIDPGVVSVRIYKQSFPERPESLDGVSLSLGTIEDEDGFGIGHLPLAPREFARWFPILLAEQEVTEDELDGYRMWKESGGEGAFGAPEQTGD